MALSIRACIFDMDDLLVRSGPQWRAAETALLERLGHAWTPELAQRYKGMNVPNIAAEIHAALRPTLAVSECQRILRARLIDEFSRGVALLPGARELLRHLHRRYPLALASGSPPECIALALKQTEVAEYFDHTISSESVARGKPFPDVFLAAARLLSAEPAKCMVFEDSLIGVQAARAADMPCCAVPSLPQHAEQISALATHTLTRLDEAAALL